MAVELKSVDQLATESGRTEAFVRMAIDAGLVDGFFIRGRERHWRAGTATTVAQLALLDQNECHGSKKSSP